MTQEIESARDAVERNAKAIMEGNFVQLMADITPEAMAEMMQMTAGQGAMTLQQLPSIDGYEVDDLGGDETGHRFDVTFRSAAGSVTLATTWKVVLGRWKVASASLVALEPHPPAPSPASAGEGETGDVAPGG